MPKKEHTVAISIIALVLIITLMIAINRMNENIPEKTYCTPETRNVGGCTAHYDPVCGWFDTTRVQCIDYPCAITIGNACEACRNNDVEYWTQGVCQSS